MTNQLSNTNNRRLSYKTESDTHKADLLQTDINNSLLSLKATTDGGKVNLSNINDVKERTFNYMADCGANAVYPSIMGLSVYGFGISRQALYKYLAKYPTSDTAEFIEMVKDVFADILTNASLYNNANAVQTIFQLKNHFGHSDKIEITPQINNTFNDISPEHLIETVKDLSENENY